MDAPKADVKEKAPPPDQPPPELKPEEKEAEKKLKRIYIAMTSDRGRNNISGWCAT